MKMYILVRDDVPLGYAMVAVAHASLAGYLAYEDHPEVIEWRNGPFRKVICKARAEEFEKSKVVADHVALTESGLNGREVAIAFRPRSEWPRMFKSLSLYEAPSRVESDSFTSIGPRQRGAVNDHAWGATT